MNLELRLYPAQAAAARVSCGELLVESEPVAGASHLLRVMGVVAALSRPQNRVVLAVRSSHEARRQHFEGPGGLWSLVEPLRQAGAAEVVPGLVKFANGSSVGVVQWEGVMKRSPNTLLIDDADGLGWAGFDRLRDRALSNPPPVVVEGLAMMPRVVAVTKDRSTSWSREHWRTLPAGHGAVVSLPASSLPDQFKHSGPPPRPALSLRGYIDITRPGFVWHSHCCLLADTLQEVIERNILRLLIQAPPRYGKSELVARSLPGYELRRRPDSWVGLASSTSKLALMLARDAQFRFKEAGGTLREDSKDVSLWRTPQGGAMWAKGVGTAILGYGFNLGLIDDPFRSRIEASSPTIQKKVYDWWSGDFLTRRELASADPAAIVVMHQRLDCNDLAGRVLAREAAAEEGVEWTILNLPALKRPRSYAFPAAARVIEDDREEGEPLCAALQTAEELKAIEAADAIVFSGVYQQDPLPSVGGGMFERHWWPPLGDPDEIEVLRQAGANLNEVIAASISSGTLPPLVREVRAWDFAATRLKKGSESSQASTVGTRAGTTGRGPGPNDNPLVIFLDQAQEFVDPADVLAFILGVARQDGREVEVMLPQDPGAAGKILVHDWQLALEREGFRVIVHTVAGKGSKRARALPHAGAAKPPFGEEAGRCRLLRGPWNEAFCEQHHNFNGLTGQMDRVDSAADAYNELEVGMGLPPAMIW